MFTCDFGSKDDTLVLLLVPMMVSGEDLQQLMHPFFSDNYRFVARHQVGNRKVLSIFLRKVEKNESV